MSIQMQPIAIVKNSRQRIEDDHWGGIISEIQLHADIPAEALEGIEAFSHVEVIFYMDQVKDEKAIPQYRHPRNDLNLPKIGTFAQRNKNRPNKIGLTTAVLLGRNENTITVKFLDAIDGTPILDIKPVMKEFEPQGSIKQPEWSSLIMQQYWKE